MVRGDICTYRSFLCGAQEKKVKGSTVLRIHEMTVIEDSELSPRGR
jgi:hypothetical protein